MGNVARLFEIMADARLELGRAEDWLACCPHEDRKEAATELKYAQHKLHEAKEELNMALVQLGRQPITSERSIHKNF